MNKYSIRVHLMQGFTDIFIEFLIHLNNFDYVCRPKKIEEFVI